LRGHAGDGREREREREAKVKEMGTGSDRIMGMETDMNGKGREGRKETENLPGKDQNASRQQLYQFTVLLICIRNDNHVFHILA
jgi:hypothetical protein